MLDSIGSANVYNTEKGTYRWLENERIIQQRVTNVAQNAENDKNRISSFIDYVKDQIFSGHFPVSGVVNIDDRIYSLT